MRPDGYGPTRFCEIYRQWARRLRPSMRQVHRAGEKTFADFSGKRPTLVDRRTGELRRVELFVAVLGTSSFTYAEAVTTQQLGDWIGAHTRMVEYFGGATALWVPDQLKKLDDRARRWRTVEPGDSCSLGRASCGGRRQVEPLTARRAAWRWSTCGVLGLESGPAAGCDRDLDGGVR